VARYKKRRRYIRLSSKKRRRARLIERDGPYCVACQLNHENLEIHHIKKRCNGGGNDLDNLALLCRTCHVLYHRNELRIDDKKDIKYFWKWTEHMRQYLDHFDVPRKNEYNNLSKNETSLYWEWETNWN
jgi:HNH endonuclease